MAKKLFQLSDKQKESIINNAVVQMRQKSQHIQEQIENYYLAEVDAFYAEYTPSEYVRHNYSDIYDSGLGRTCKPILEERRTGDKITFESGIEIDTSRMHRDYHGTPEQVLNSFMNGYHGLPPYKDMKTGATVYPPMISDLRPVEDTWNFVDKVLLQNMDFSIKV